MLLSVREVLQLSRRCFVAAGFDEGAATANARRVWWAEAYKRTGLSTLHDLLESFPDLDPDREELRRHNPLVSVIDSGTRPGVAASTPALDLSCAHADAHGIGIAYATAGPEDPSRPLLGHVAYDAAERGFHAVLLQGGAADSRTVVAAPEQPRPLVAECELPSPSESYRLVRDVVDAGLDHRRHNPLAQAFFDGEAGEEAYATADARLADRLLCRSVEPAGRAADEPGFVVLCLDPSHPFHSSEIWQVAERFVTGDDRLEVYRPEALQERVGELVENGVEVDRAVWRDVFEFSKGVLAPPFEGSEQGAGFGLNDLTE